MSDGRIEIRIEDPGDATEVEVIGVKVSVGAVVAQGDVLMEVATDKANVDIEAPAAGTLEELLVAEGDVIPADGLLAVLRT